jgi:hypothetical protein
LHITFSKCIFDLYSASSESGQNGYVTFNLASYETIICLYICQSTWRLFPSFSNFFFLTGEDMFQMLSSVVIVWRPAFICYRVKVKTCLVSYKYRKISFLFKK